jgi:hypothetical protein
MADLRLGEPQEYERRKQDCRVKRSDERHDQQYLRSSVIATGDSGIESVANHHVQRACYVDCIGRKGRRTVAKPMANDRG